MKSIFNADDNAELINRINQLSDTSQALWGKMSPAQMMAHCQASMNMAFGNTKKNRHWIGKLLGSISKNRLLRVTTFDRNMPTYKKFEIATEKDFNKEKDQFITLIQSALIKSESALVKYPHPYFCTFKPGEWSQLNWKHLDHHFRQFDV